MSAGEGGQEGQEPGGGATGPPSPAHGGEAPWHADVTAASAASVAASASAILSTMSTKRRAPETSPLAVPPAASSPLQLALDAPLGAPRFSLGAAPNAVGAASGGQCAESDKAAAVASSSSAVVISKTERLMETWERSIHSLNTLFKPKNEAARQQDLEAEAAGKVLALAAQTRLAAFSALTSKGLVWADASWRQRLEACLAIQPAAPALERANSSSLADGLVDPDALPRLRDRHRASSLVLARPPGYLSSDTVHSPLAPGVPHFPSPVSASHWILFCISLTRVSLD